MKLLIIICSTVILTANAAAQSHQTSIDAKSFPRPACNRIYLQPSCKTSVLVDLCDKIVQSASQPWWTFVPDKTAEKRLVRGVEGLRDYSPRLHLMRYSLSYEKWSKAKAYTFEIRPKGLETYGQGSYLGQGWFVTAEHVLSNSDSRTVWTEDDYFDRTLDIEKHFSEYSVTLVNGQKMLTKEIELELTSTYISIDLTQDPLVSLKFKAKASVYTPYPEDLSFTPAERNREIFSSNIDLSFFKIDFDSIIPLNSDRDPIDNDNSLRSSVVNKLSKITVPKVSLLKLNKESRLEVSSGNIRHFAFPFHGYHPFNKHKFFSERFLYKNTMGTCVKGLLMESTLSNMHGIEKLPSGVAGPGDSGSGVVSMIKENFAISGVLTGGGAVRLSELEDINTLGIEPKLLSIMTIKQDDEIFNASRLVNNISVGFSHNEIKGFVRAILPQSMIIE